MYPHTIVYTAIIGPYDDLHEPEVVCPDCMYLCFTDQPFTSRTWTMIPIERGDEDPQFCARRHKILAHFILPSCAYSLWIDGRSTLKQTPDVIIDQYLSEYDMALFAHPDRDCVYEEAAYCTTWNMDDPAIIARHMDAYHKEGYPPHAGLAATGFLLRQHTSRIAAFNEAWWQEVMRFYSRRDQLTFNPVCRRLNMSYAVLEGNCFSNPLVECRTHRQSEALAHKR